MNSSPFESVDCVVIGAGVVGLAIARALALAGGEGMRLLSAGEARAMEPNLHCTAALLSPSTGIIDSHSYMLALQGDAEERGAMLAFHSPVKQGRVVDGGIEIEVGGTEPMNLHCR